MGRTEAEDQDEDKPIEERPGTGEEARGLLVVVA